MDNVPIWDCFHQWICPAGKKTMLLLPPILTRHCYVMWTWVTVIFYYSLPTTYIFEQWIRVANLAFLPSLKSFMVRLYRRHCAHMRLLSPVNMSCRKNYLHRKTPSIEVWYPIQYNHIHIIHTKRPRNQFHLYCLVNYTMMIIKNRITNKNIFSS